jgi:hypothetical protein
MSLRYRAALSVATAAMVGANIAQGWVILTAYWWTDQLPASQLFRAGLYAVWLPIAVLAAGLGLVAAFRLALGRRGARKPLLAFAWAFTLVMKIDGYELGWSFARLAVNVGTDRVAAGVNVLGVAVLVWLLGADLVAEPESAPPASAPGPHAA